jgi:hypothetical protein
MKDWRIAKLGIQAGLKTQIGSSFDRASSHSICCLNGVQTPGTVSMAVSKYRAKAPTLLIVLPPGHNTRHFLM